MLSAGMVGDPTQPGEAEMQLILKLDVVDDGNVIECTEIWRCEDVGASPSPGHLGLLLADGKTICAALQQAVLQQAPST